MSKRILAIFIATVLVVSLGGCGTTETEPIKNEVAETSETETISHRENMYGISDKNVDDVKGSFSTSKVRNDVTGNWRISTIASTIPTEEYALSYYKKYFENDSEVHWIVNFTLNTTTNITSSGTMLYVTVHEYTNKEEHDAKILGGGMVLSEYIIYTDNGDIEQLR